MKTVYSGRVTLNGTGWRILTSDKVNGCGIRVTENRLRTEMKKKFRIEGGREEWGVILYRDPPVSKTRRTNDTIG